MAGVDALSGCPVVAAFPLPATHPQPEPSATAEQDGHHATISPSPTPKDGHEHQLRADPARGPSPSSPRLVGLLATHRRHRGWGVL
jgi:hypothetical protein